MKFAVALLIVFAAATDAAAKNLYIPAAGSAPGAIRLDSDTDISYEFSADSRTYTDSPHAAAPGTYGQFIPALDPNVAATKTGVVLHVSNSAAFRTNAGVMNPNREAITARATFVHADGTLVAESAPFTVPAMSMTLQPLAQLFGDLPVVADGYLVINTSLHAFPFASVVDNQSGDAIFVNAVQDIIE